MIPVETLQRVPELIQSVHEFSGFISPAVSIFITFAMAFSARQRAAIVERDGNKCQATAEHVCNEERGLEVDHIIPQFYASIFGIDPDYPENALSKCKNAHDIKHPDRIKARREYHALKAQGIDAFGTVLREERREKIKNHLIYWNDKNDRTDSVRAVQLTQKKRVAGWVFPEKPKHREPKAQVISQPQEAQMSEQTQST